MGHVDMQKHLRLVWKIQNVIKDEIKLDNRYIVNYNRTLCLKYYAHVNVEICFQSILIKYLFKYLTKGPDIIRAVIKDNIII